MVDIHIRLNEPIRAAQLLQLRKDVGWVDSVDYRRKVSHILENSYFHLSVWINDNLVGFCDCISDGHSNALIQDLMVHPDYQGMGIGSAIITRMLKVLKERGVFAVSVLCNKQLRRFYKKLGFTIVTGGYLETKSVK